MSVSSADNSRADSWAPTISVGPFAVVRAALASLLALAGGAIVADGAVASTPPSALRGTPAAFLADVKEQVTPGNTGLIAVGTRGRAHCALSFAGPGGLRAGPYVESSRARAYGTWKWKVARGARAGSWTAAVQCGRVRLSTSVLVGGSGTKAEIVTARSMRFKVTAAPLSPQLVVPAEPHGGRGTYPNGGAACRWTGKSTGRCSGDNWGYKTGSRWSLTSARGFPYRSVTDYAAWVLGLQSASFGFFGTHGAAIDWRANAGRAGLTVTPVARVGDLAWWGHEAVGGQGYLAVITAVNARSGALTVAAYNADGLGHLTLTTIVRHADAYLEPAGVSDGPSGVGAPTSSAAPPGGLAGRQDIVAAEPNGFGGTRYVVGYNNGSGQRFRWVASNLTREPYATLMAVGDLNGDGRADVIATDPACGPGHVDYVVGISNGNGTFDWRHTNLTCAPSAIYIGLGDVFGNGRTDIVAEEPAGLGEVQFVVYSNDGTGLNWSRRVTNLANIEHPSDVAVGAVSASGRADIVAAEPGGTFMVGLSKGDGSFTWTPTNLTTGLPVEHLALGDVVGNGRQDIVVGEPSPSGGTEYAVAENNGSGVSYTWAPTVTGTSPAQQITLADINGDGKADIVAATPQASCFGGSSYAVGLSNGDGTFATRSTNLPCNVAPIAIGVGKVLG